MDVGQLYLDDEKGVDDVPRLSLLILKFLLFHVGHWFARLLGVYRSFDEFRLVVRRGMCAIKGEPCKGSRQLEGPNLFQGCFLPDLKGAVGRLV